MKNHIQSERTVEIITWKKAGKNGNEIAQLTGIPRCIIYRILKRNKLSQSLARKPGSGRPSLLNNSTKQILIKNIKKFPTYTANMQVKKLKECRGIEIKKEL